MTKGMLAKCYAAAVLLAGAGFYGACNDTVMANDCKVKCQDVDNTCVQGCKDDSCKTVCSTDLDNCRASCDSITISPPPANNADAGH